MVELIYNAGYRGGEAYAADAASVYPQDRQIAVNWQALSLPGLPTRQARPKHGRARTTNYPDVTLTGFALHDALCERLERIDWEHSKGRNPKRLLFPAPQGGWWWASAFTIKYFNVAAAAAGWEARTWVDEHGRDRRLWVHTAHSLRHRTPWRSRDASSRAASRCPRPLCSHRFGCSWAGSVCVGVTAARLR
jgi:hypothetical protein